MPETRIPPTDDTLEQYLAGKSEVSRLYREMPMETTSAELDGRIMRAARKELRPKASRWMLPLSAAAVAVFAVSIVLNLQHEDISRMLPQQRPELAPQTVPLSEEPQPEAASQDVLPTPSAAGPAAEQRSALKSAPPGVITTDQSAAAPDATPRAVPETGVAPSAPIPAGEEDAGQPSAYGTAPQQMEVGDSERRESAPAAAMPRSASPKAADSAGSANNSGAAGVLSAGSAEKSERDEKSPEAWIEHIRNLRIAGRDREAQAEFEAFHDRYPDYALPPDLEPGN